MFEQVEALAKDLWAVLVLKGSLPVMDVPSIAESQSDGSSSRDDADERHLVHSLQEEVLSLCCQVKTVLCVLSLWQSLSVTGG